MSQFDGKFPIIPLAISVHLTYKLTSELLLKCRNFPYRLKEPIDTCDLYDASRKCEEKYSFDTRDALKSVDEHKGTELLRIHTDVFKY